MTSEQRAAVVVEALSWQGTPYHHRAALKGVGADCALFPLAVYRAVLKLPEIAIPAYPMQWMLHNGTEIYLAAIEELGATETEELAPGNFMTVRYGRTFSHGAIILDWPNVIHAVNPRGVTLADATLDVELVTRARKVFSL